MAAEMLCDASSVGDSKLEREMYFHTIIKEERAASQSIPTAKKYFQLGCTGNEKQ